MEGITGKVTWQIDHLVQGEGTWTHEAVQILLIMNQAWFRRLNTERHDYGGRRGLTNLTPYSDGAHSYFVLDLTWDNVFVEFTFPVVREVLVRGKGMVEGSLRYFPLKGTMNCLTGTPFFIQSRIVFLWGWVFVIWSQTAKWRCGSPAIKPSGSRTQTSPADANALPFATDSIEGSVDEYNGPPSPGGHLIKRISRCRNFRFASRGWNSASSSHRGRCGVYGEKIKGSNRSHPEREDRLIPPPEFKRLKVWLPESNLNPGWSGWANRKKLPRGKTVKSLCMNFFLLCSPPFLPPHNFSNGPSRSRRETNIVTDYDYSQKKHLLFQSYCRSRIII